MMENLENMELNIMELTMMHMMTYWMDMKVTIEIMGKVEK